MGKSLTQEEVTERVSLNFANDVILIGEYKNKRTKVKLKCLDCGHEWDGSPSTFLFRQNCECPNCGAHSKQSIKLHCAYCGKILYRRPSEIKNNKSGYFYCSHECGNKHKASLLITEDSSNYRLKAMNKYLHKCACCGWNEDERVLEVHHIDENRSNNNVENLCILCPTCHRKITLGYYLLTEDFKLIPKD